MRESSYRQETVMVCLPPSDQASDLVRRGALLAERRRARIQRAAPQ